MRRFGIVRFPLDDMLKRPEFNARVFALLRFMPLSVEQRGGIADILGWSEQFDTLDTYDLAPIYDLVIGTDESGVPTAVHARKKL